MTPAREIERAVETFLDVGHAVLPGFLDPEAVLALREGIVSVVSSAGDTWTSDDTDRHPGYDVWVAGVDKADDVPFELARSVPFVDLIERLLGGPVVPLRCNYAATLPGSPGCVSWTVDATRYARHFGDLSAGAICLPLTPTGAGTGGIEFRSAHGVATASPGDALLYHARTPHRISANTGVSPTELAIFAYRVSPQRQTHGHGLASV